MKAVRIHRHGGPEVLAYEDVPEPRPRADQVLVRVRACALNHLDLWVRNGIPGAQIPLPHILGSDIAGEVAETGEFCERIRPGQRVLLAPALSCRQCRECVSGRDNRCSRYSLFGYQIPGGNAEYLAVPEYAAIPIPDQMTFDQAAAVPLVFLTAYHMLFDRARLQPGETVLVVAASSGVGSAAVQLAKWRRCRVLATAGGEAKLAKAKELGADEVVDHYAQDFAAEVKRLTDRHGADVVFEHVGAATWPKSVQCLAPGGRLVTCGATTGPEVALDIRFLFYRQQSVLGSFMGALGELYEVLDLVFRGEVRPVIDSVFPLAEAAAAHRRLENKEQFGKVVLVV